MNEEFEEFFIQCQKVTNSNQKEIERILRPLKVFMWKQQLKKYLKIILVFATICFGIYYIDTFNWYFCAFGRLAMIRMLSIWDWRHLESAKCLIPRTQAQKSTGFSRLNEKDCRACEHFDKIEVLQETSYSLMYDKFLIRGLPVIITDTSTDFNKSQSLFDFIENVVQNMSGMVQEDACSLETNLMMSRYATVDETFSILQKIVENKEAMMPWFISFRNCQFKALKASRLMMKKPYFYPRNLQSPSSSWLLMSQNYKNYQNDLNLYGLIIVSQLKGSLKISLKAKLACLDFCNDLHLELFAGESLTFLTHLWTFSYQFFPEKTFSLTFITETDFDF